MDNQCSLKKILEREPYILSDGDVLTHGCSRWYSRFLYDSHKPDDLSKIKESLDDVIECLRLRRDWFSKQNVFTTPAVVKEIERFQNILQGKKCELNRYRNCSKMNEIYEAHSQILSESKKRTLKINNLRYDAIYGFVCEVSKNSNAKNYCKIISPTKSDKYQDLHADEELVASALYFSLIENQPSVIVTPDNDLSRLAVSSVSKLINPELDECKFILHQLLFYPFSVYHVFETMLAEKAFCSRNPPYSKKPFSWESEKNQALLSKLSEECYLSIIAPSPITHYDPSNVFLTY